MTPIQQSVNLAAVGAYKEAHRIVFDYRRDPETPLEERISREPWEHFLAARVPAEPFNVWKWAKSLGRVKA